MERVKEKIKNFFTIDKSIQQVYSYFDLLIDNIEKINIVGYNKIILSIFDLIYTHYNKLYDDFILYLKSDKIYNDFFGYFSDISAVNNEDVETEKFLNIIKQKEINENVDNFVSCSDIHGDFINLMNIIFNSKAEPNYLFMGDVFDTFNGSFNYFSENKSLFDICDFDKINDKFSLAECINSNKIAFGYFSSIVVFYLLMYLYFHKGKNIYFILGNHELNYDIKKFYFFIFVFYGLLIDESDKKKIIFLSYLNKTVKNKTKQRNIIFTHQPINYNNNLPTVLYIKNHHVYKLLVLIIFHIFNSYNYRNIVLDLESKGKDVKDFMKSKGQYIYLLNQIGEQQIKLNSSYFNKNIENIDNKQINFYKLFTVELINFIEPQKFGDKTITVFYDFQFFNYQIHQLLYDFYSECYHSIDRKSKACIEQIYHKCWGKLKLAESDLNKKMYVATKSIIPFTQDETVMLYQDIPGYEIPKIFKEYFFNNEIKPIDLNFFGHSFETNSLNFHDIKKVYHNCDPKYLFNDYGSSKNQNYLLNIDPTLETIKINEKTDNELIDLWNQKNYFFNCQKIKLEIEKKYWILMFLYQRLYFPDEENKINKLINKLLIQKLNNIQTSNFICSENVKIQYGNKKNYVFDLFDNKLKNFSLDWNSSYFQIAQLTFKHQTLKLNVNQYFYNTVSEKDKDDLKIIYYSPCFFVHTANCFLTVLSNYNLYLKMDQIEKVFNYYMKMKKKGLIINPDISKDDLLKEYINYCTKESDYLVLPNYSFKQLDKLIEEEIKTNKDKDFFKDHYKNMMNNQILIFESLKQIINIEENYTTEMIIFKDNIETATKTFRISANPEAILNNLKKTAYLIYSLNNALTFPNQRKKAEDVKLKPSVLFIIAHIQFILQDVEFLTTIKEKELDQKLKNQYVFYLMTKIINFVKLKINLFCQKNPKNLNILIQKIK